MFRGRVDRRQLERAMRQLGMSVKELEGVQEVVIKLADREIVLPNARVTLMELPGQRTYQVSGKEIERRLGPSEEDVKLVMEQAGVGREEAVSALKECEGDLARAILKLSEPIRKRM